MEASFVGRDREMALAGAAIAAWRAGRQVVLEVVGPMGIGKSRLIREAVRRHAGTVPVLTGRAVEAERSVPFHVITHAVIHAEHLATATTQQWERLCLTRDDPATRYGQARELLARTAAHDPMVLVLEDLHWADPDTIGLVDHLIRYPVDAPLLLVAAYRPDATPEGWRRLADRHEKVRRLAVGPLPADAARLLLGAPVTPGAAPGIGDDAGGNPGYLLATAAPGTAGQWDAERRLVDEWAQLAAPDRTVTSASAVIGDGFDLDLLAAVTCLPATDAEAALGRLVRRGLLRPTAGALFRIAHPVLQRLIHERIAPLWRLGAHRRTLAHLRGRSVPARVLAPHVLRALTLPGADAGHDDVAVLRDAARDVSRTDPRAAADWLRVALTTLDASTAAGPLRQELCWELAGVLGAAGELAECRALLHDVLWALPDDPTCRRAELVAMCGRMEWLLGHYAEAGAMLRQELALVDWGTAVHAVELAVQYGAVSLLTGDVAAATEVLDAAAGSTGDRVDRATVLAVQAFSEIHQGDTAAARASAAASAPLIDGVGDAELVDALESLGALGLAEFFLERFDDADRHFRRGEALARRTGRDLALPFLLLGRCQVAYWAGRLPDAVGFAQQAQRTADGIGSRDLRCFGLAFESECTAWLGTSDTVRALALARESVQVAGPDDAGYARRTASMALANALLLTGDGHGSIRVVLDIGHGPELPNLQANMRPTWYWMVCMAALLEGDVEAAHGWADRAETHADRIALAGQRGFADLARLHVLLAEGDSAGALDRARAAVSGFSRARMVLPRGVALAGAARAAAAEGDIRLAANLRAQATEAGQRCGSQRIERMIDAVDPVGVGTPAPQSRLPATALTTRERQIAELTLTGATAHAIGRALTLSPRTVDAHLSRIYRKLNVSSRAALVAHISRSGPRVGGPG